MRAIHFFPSAIAFCTGIAVLLIVPEEAAARVPFAFLNFGMAVLLGMMARRRHGIEVAKRANRLAEKLRPEVSGHLSLSPRLRAGIEEEIAEGEKIVWLVRPDPGETVQSDAAPIICIVLLIAALLGGLLLTGSDAPLTMLAGILVVLSPLSLLPINDTSRARNTAYVITNRRAILFLGGINVWRWGWVLDIHSFPPERLQNLICEVKPDGSGNLILHRRDWIDDNGDTRHSDTGFMGIPNVREAEKLARDLAKLAKA